MSKWIPTSERLPTKVDGCRGLVWITNRSGRVHVSDWNAQGFRGSRPYFVAWRPINPPEPYDPYDPYTSPDSPWKKHSDAFMRSWGVSPKRWTWESLGLEVYAIYHDGAPVTTLTSQKVAREYCDFKNKEES